MNITMKIFIVLIMVYLINHQVDCQGSEDSENCQHKNTVYVTNQSSTQATCDNPKPDVQTKDSKNYCACKNGYVLDNYVSKNCIPLEECPQFCAKDANSEYKKCQSSTRATCKNPEVTEQTTDCQNFCVCKDGYLYDENNKKCVLPEDCH